MFDSTIPTQKTRAKGLERPVEILIDQSGVPHIYAETEADAYFGQGYAVARDRLWQIDLWRKRGLGHLAADHGSNHLEADRAARLLLYRGDIGAEWAAYGPDARMAAEAFVAGINTRIAQAEADPALMPVEFTRTATVPHKWDPEDCVRIRSHGPLFNFTRELTRADIVNRFGLDAELMRRQPEPDWTIQMPTGMAAESVPPEVRRTFDLGTGQPSFGSTAPSETDIGGSNNWVVAADQTDTGRPIFASDPHRLLMLPSLRYVSHLVAPGLNVIGAGEPSIPGIALGHNDTSAFSFTIHPADQSDLYVYKLHPADPEQYLYDGAWERMQIVEEVIEVRGQDPQSARLCFTRHGPVLHADPKTCRGYALRSIWSAPGSAPYVGALRYLKAKTWEEFVAACSHWMTPTLNHLFANTAGEIGWIMSGRIPHRANWDGLLPVAGDGSHEWADYMPAEAHPRIHNPTCGWVATANEMNLPPDFDYQTHKPGFEWCDPGRYQAIARELNRPEKHTLSDSQALQTSFACINAERLISLLPALEPQNPTARRAVELMSGWDGSIAPDSAPALLFELWFRKHLIKLVVERIAPGTIQSYNALDIAGFDTLQITDLLVSPTAQFGPDPLAQRNEILETALAAAWTEAEALAGKDPGKWRWDRLHHARFTHPLSSLLQDASLNTRRVGKGGSGLTPNAADYDPDGFQMTVGASFRMVLDIGNWDAGLFVNAPGQSGDPNSRHYDDHLDAWGNETYLPMRFSRGCVEAGTVLRLVLSP